MAKKRKVDDSDGPSTATSGDPSPVKFIRDHQIWFEDGNIIIRVASNHTRTHGFRCHGSVLAARSPVFATMLQLPNDGGEKIDGVACVDLPDSCRDVRGLLRFLYGFTTVIHGEYHWDTLCAISGPLRLAAKYEMKDITRQLVPVLEKDWPSAYSDWLQGEKEIEAHLSRNGTQAMGARQDPALAVQLGHQARIRSILPAAYYDLSRILLRPPPFDDADYCQRRWAESSFLERDDLERLAAGRERLAYYVRQQLHPNVLSAVTAAAHIAHLACSCSMGRGAARVCVPILRDWWAARRQSASRWDAILQDPVRGLEELADGMLDLTNWTWGKDLARSCVHCRESFAQVLRSEAESIWKQLPKFFELDSLPF
ncbi:BTB/POZ domain-containing protein [Phanerochaete sordida]|uniref:BTB/POZ domain-containing protein n=1 Tax=Phanerochaete sordida TaxID=48140 RepID=A0A9P3G351_9APHY|nr:BTB/POZ domain-containing protein [Phanerochaete sordida]